MAIWIQLVKGGATTFVDYVINLEGAARASTHYYCSEFCNFFCLI